MKALKIMLISAIAAGTFTICHSQTIYFGYDDAGNRIVRSTTPITLKSTAQGDSLDQPEQHEIKEMIGEQDIIIYPNPVQSEITVNIPGLDEGVYATISLYGQKGELLYRNDKAGYTGKISLSDYPAGIYFMNITIQGKTIQWKVVKE